MKTKRIGVLMGGVSSEREVSLRTGRSIAATLRARGYDVQEIVVDRDVDRVLRDTPIDVAFLALHGTYGEDGCIQGLLELRGIPYTGSGVMASALAMDKLKSKQLFRLYNVSTPPYYAVRASDLATLDAVHGSFGFPVFVKPRSQGSSVGAGRADDASQLALRCAEALRHDDCALVERFVAGRELAVALIDGKALGAIEIVPKGGFYDYKSKYTAGQTDYFCPAELPRALEEEIRELARRSHEALGCGGYSRVDFRLSPENVAYCLEVNTLPGMTATSLVPKAAAAAGMSFPALCERIIELALTPQPAEI